MYFLCFLIIFLIILVIFLLIKHSNKKLNYKKRYIINNNYNKKISNNKLTDGGGCETNKNYSPTSNLYDINNLILNPKNIKNNKNNVKICLTFCRLTTSIVCGNKKNILNLKLRYGKNLFFIFNQFNKIIGTLVFNKNILLIAWKGSILTNDLVSDLQLELVPLTTPYTKVNKKIQVDKGFLNLFNVSKTLLKEKKVDVITIINYIIKTNNIKHIFSTGHSLGAGISTISSFIYSNLYKNIKIYNYVSGVPRSGNKEFADNYNKKNNLKTQLLINLIDLVPNLPSLGINKYKHVNINKEQSILVFNGAQDTYLDNHMPPIYYNNIDNSVYLKFFKSK